MYSIFANSVETDGKPRIVREYRIAKSEDEPRETGYLVFGFHCLRRE